MTTDTLSAIRVESVFLPSDFSPASAAAFAHALKIALVAKARLSILHVSDEGKVDWSEFPGVRETLVRWGLLAEGSARTAVADLGVEVRKVAMTGKDPVAACLQFLFENPADLIVVAVRHDNGGVRWFQRSVGEPIAQKSGEMTLFLPNNVDGFVSLTDGSINLKSILIPVAEKPIAQPSIDATARFLHTLQLPAGNVQLLHVSGSKRPVVHIPTDTNWTWTYDTRPGEPVKEILAAAESAQADLIVMTTDGPDGFLDGLRGTTSQRVMYSARCPVLILPLGAVFV